MSNYASPGSVCSDYCGDFVDVCSDPLARDLAGDVFPLSLSPSLSLSFLPLSRLLLRTSSSNPYFLFACDVVDVTLSPLSV